MPSALHDLHQACRVPSGRSRLIWKSLSGFSVLQCGQRFMPPSPSPPNTRTDSTGSDRPRSVPPESRNRKVRVRLGVLDLSCDHRKSPASFAPAGNRGERCRQLAAVCQGGLKGGPVDYRRFGRRAGHRRKKPHGSAARPGGRGEYVVVRIGIGGGLGEHLGGV